LKTIASPFPDNKRGTNRKKQLPLLRLFETPKQMKVYPNIVFADARRRHKI